MTPEPSPRCIGAGMLRPLGGRRWPEGSPNGNPSGNCVSCGDAFRSVRIVTTAGVTLATRSAYPSIKCGADVAVVDMPAGAAATTGAATGSYLPNVAPFIAAT